MAAKIPVILASRGADVARWFPRGLGVETFGLRRERSGRVSAAGALEAQVRPLDHAVGHAPLLVGEALQIDEGVGAALVLGAAAVAIGVATGVVGRHLDGLGP